MTRLFIAQAGATAAAGARLRYGGVVVGPVDPDQSYVTVGPSPIFDDGETLIEVGLEDDSSHPVEGQTVTITPIAGVTITPPSAVSDAQGMCTFTATPVAPLSGTFNVVAVVTATPDDITITQQPSFEVESRFRDLYIDGGVDIDVFDEAGQPDTYYYWTIIVTDEVRSMSMGGTWPVGSSFSLLNLSKIYGVGGTGGSSRVYSLSPTDGGTGGTALELNGLLVSIDNDAGCIFGGGGGGGAGGSANGVTGDFSTTALVNTWGGSGGGGAGDGDAGAGAVFTTAAISPGGYFRNTVGSISNGPFTMNLTQINTLGDNGDSSDPGAGGVGGAGNGTDGVDATGGDGGAGGAFGEAGEDGDGGTTTLGSVWPTGGAGGAAGKAINLSGGTANFVSGNTAERVKGAVS